MSDVDIFKRFNELYKDDKISCTQVELDTFLNYGLLLSFSDKYVTRNNKPVNIDLIESKTYNLNINLNSLIAHCNMLSKKTNYKKIFCMSQSCYNKYKQDGLIIQDGENEYYKDIDQWLVYIIS